MKSLYTILHSIVFFSLLNILHPLNAQVSSNTTLIGRWANGPCYTVDVVGSLAYFGNGGYLMVVDVANPATPIEIGKVVLPASVQGVVVNGAFAYVANGDDGLRIINIGNPANLVEAGFFDTNDWTQGVAVSGAFAYVADGGSGLRIIDVSNPANPIEAGFFDTDGFAWDVAVSNSFAYVADGFDGLRIIGVSNPANPVEVGYFDTGGYAAGVVVSSAFAYVADEFGGLRIINVNDPANPFEVAYYDISDASSVAVSGAFAYVADGDAGLRIIDVSDPNNLVQTGYFNTGGFAVDVAISTAFAYLADDFAGLRVIDVSDPANPVEAGYFNTSGYAVDVAINETFAYMTDNWGLQIIDVSDPVHPVKIGYLFTGEYSWGVAVSSAFAYVANESAGLRIIDVSDPANPVGVGYFAANGNAFDVAVSGDFAYVASGVFGLWIIDVSDPANPIEAGYFDTGGYAAGVAVSDAFVYVADEFAGVRIIDVSDPASPVEAGFFDTGGQALGVAVSGAFAYVADGPDGLRIIDVSDPLHPVEVGYLFTGEYVWGVAISDAFAYVADGGDAGLRIINVSNPANPVEAGYFASGGYARGVAVNGDLVYLADWDDGLYIIRNDLIATSSVTLTAPNVGETWQVGSQQNITWISTGVTNVKIEYSTNGGASWEPPIVASYPAGSQSYPWTIPNTPSLDCLVKISDANDPTVVDISDQTFIITLNSLNEGLIAYYPFNGNANDESGNGNNGTVIGANLTEDRFGNAQSAYQFDGQDDYITAPNSVSLQSPDLSFSIVAWTYINSWYSVWGSICAKSNNSSFGQYGLAIRSDGLYEIRVANTNVSIPTTAQFQLNTWYFIGITWDGNKIDLYLDGNKINTYLYTSQPQIDTFPLEIGRDTPGDTEYMNGKLDDIRIYNRALSEAEIQILYNDAYTAYAVVEGRVLSETGGAPVENAHVRFPIINKSVITNSEGKFSIFVSPGSGYSIEFSATNYFPKQLNNLTLMPGLVQLDDVYLTPSLEEEYDLIELALDPNPQVSTVQAGGILTRYYQVVGKTSGIPTNGIEVEFENINGLFSKIFESGTYRDILGVLRVEFSAEEIGCINCDRVFSVKRIHNNSNPNSPIIIPIEVQFRAYKKEFEIAREFEIGIGISVGGGVSGEIESETTPTFEFIESDGAEAEPDKITITDNIQSAKGVEFDAGLGAKIQVGPVGIGGYGGVSGGVYRIMEGQAKYNYDYNVGEDQDQAFARLRNLSNSAVSLAPTPLWVSTLNFLIGVAVNHPYLEDIGAGVGVKGSGSVEGMVGLLSSRRMGVGIGGSGFYEHETGSLLHFDYLKTENIFQGSLHLFEKTTSGIGIGLLTWQYAHPGNPNFKRINEIQEKSQLGLYFTGEHGKEVSMSLRSDRYLFSSTIGTNDQRRNFAFSIHYPDFGALLQSLGSAYLDGLFSISDPNQPVLPMPDLGNDFLNQFNDRLLIKVSEQQELGLLPPGQYQEDNSLTHSSSFDAVNFNWKAGLKINFGFGLDWKTAHTASTEKGAFVGGTIFPTEYYNTIPEVSTPTKTSIWHIIKEGFSNIKWSDLFHISFFKRDNLNQIVSDTTFVLSLNGSTLQLDPASLPAQLDTLHCLTWNWYGKSTAAKLSDLSLQHQKTAVEVKRRQQALAKLDYGIGGFYKFAPDAVPLSTPGVLTLVYPDSEVVNFPESNLAIFYQDTLSTRWHYLGGVVDSINNTISASVDTLHLFTIAPIAPDGEFGLESDRDTLINDSMSVATVWADNLMLSNGQSVGSGRLYTITAENVLIETADVDTTIPGIQVNSLNSRIEFQVKSTRSSGKAVIRADSYYGLSKGVLELTVADTTNPLIPAIVAALPGDQEIQLVISNPDTFEIGRYEIHYDIDSGPPYTGQALVGGENSPFIVPAADTISVPLLGNNTLYYLAVRGIDGAGNLSEFSNEVSAAPVDVILPGKIQMMDFSLMADSSYLARWIASGDNGYSGRAARYYLKVSNQAVTDTLLWWTNAIALINVTEPNDPYGFDYHVLSSTMVDTSYRLGIMVEDESANQSAVTIFSISENRATRSISLRQGWNLVSHPVKPPKNITALYPYVQGGPYIFQNPGGYAFSDTIPEKTGFWIWPSQAYSKNFNGPVIADTLIPVKVGWNLIGANSYSTPVSQVSSIPPGIISSMFFAYDTTGYYIPSSIEFANGYWIRTTQDGFIVLGSQTSTAKPLSNAILERGITIITANGIQKTLWLVKEEFLEFLEAAPLPPGGIDIRFGSNRIGEKEDQEHFEIVIQNAQYPLTLALSHITGQDFEITGGSSGKFYGILSKDSEIKIDNPKDIKILVHAVQIPKAYYLNQNYPNPFNAETIIRFGLPEKQKVNMVVYDVLGRKVESLLKDTPMEAGHHKITWDAGKYASGVYFLHLKAGKYSSTKKLLLVK